MEDDALPPGESRGDGLHGRGVVPAFGERGGAGVRYRAVRDDETAARALGIDVRRVRLESFTLGAGVAGLAGGLFAHYLGILEPTYKDVVEGHAEVREVFAIGKRGKIAGCQVLDGRLVRGATVHVIRGGKVIYKGTISSLRHYKQDVTEMAAGFECGVGVEGFNDFQPGDLLETHRQERVS